jgi:hypothetical protein
MAKRVRNLEPAAGLQDVETLAADLAAEGDQRGVAQEFIAEFGPGGTHPAGTADWAFLRPLAAGVGR